MLDKMLKPLLITVILISISLNYVNSVSISKSAYRDIVIEIQDTVPAEECSNVLINLEKSVTKASEFLFAALDGRAYFGSVIIIYPTHWPQSCVPAGQQTIPASGEKSDISITATHPIYNDRAWTKQYGGCGEQGEQIYLSYNGLEHEQVGKELVREWAKYRYGVFDEHGYTRDPVYPKCYLNDRWQVTGCSDTPLPDNGYCDDASSKTINDTIDPSARTSILFSVESPSVEKFCDAGTHNPYAPTKHNFMCDRNNTLEVILKHTDFLDANMLNIKPATIVITTPKFQYKTRQLTRYLLVIDDTHDMNYRESFDFLRFSLRKWIVYDLPDNSEVGVIRANEIGGHIIGNLTSLKVQKHRDSIASKIPYPHDDSQQQANLGGALKLAIQTFKDRNLNNGPASSVIILIAPGMNFQTDFRSIANLAKNDQIRIATINYPDVIRRQPLDPLATLTDGVSYTVYEQKLNAEKSSLTTYFELSNIMNHIGMEYYEGNKMNLPIEIHRKEIVDNTDESNGSGKRTRQITGSFMLDQSVGEPSAFYVYIHDSVHPLVQSITLTSPSGVVYPDKSETRIFLKQLISLSVLNETGSWSYTIQRYTGSPQPHYVQVMTTPKNSGAPVITAKSWVKRTKSGPIILYAEVKKGELPVQKASVEVIISRPDIQCNETGECKTKIQLLDNGSGDPDVMKGDGIYSRYFDPSQTGHGTYRFEITVSDNGNTAYTLASRDSLDAQESTCCGSVVPSPSKEPLPSCHRHLPAHTITFTKEQLAETDTKISYGKIGDLRGEVLSGQRVRLSWTSPDMGGKNVARYEVKYATKLADIVDNYDTAAIYWDHDTPLVFSIGDESTFTLNLTNENHLLGKHLYFAIRGYSQLTYNAAAGPISNYVHVYVPHPQVTASTIFPPYFTGDEDNLSNYDPNDSNNDLGYPGNYNDIIPKLGKNFNSIEYIILFSLISLIFLFVFIIICIFLMKRRSYRNSNTTDDKKTINKNNDSKNNMINVMIEQPPPPQTISQPQLDESQICQQQYQQQQMHIQQPSYAYDQSIIDEIPDPHTVGLPIYTENYDYSMTKRYSIVNQQEQQLIEELKNQQNNYNNGLSIISTATNTLVRNGRTLSPYESWTASQLLHEHERRISPMDEMMHQHDHISLINGPNCDRISITTTTTTAPPVPPLPYGGTNNVNGGYPVANNYNLQRDLSGIPFNPSLQGSICSVNSGEKKRQRNVTMV